MLHRTCTLNKKDDPKKASDLAQKVFSRDWTIKKGFAGNLMINMKVSNAEVFWNDELIVEIFERTQRRQGQ